MIVDHTKEGNATQNDVGDDTFIHFTEVLTENKNKIVYRVMVDCRSDQIDFVCALLQHQKTLAVKK